ncbi:hypothetical protein BLNAU_4426 [Blattamonas nauphoetae]|uniref:Uncharacterized protein n=1 Tax=Blattamonas nauphoetae TaxID=2049346 RepID=A0ABQ9Y9U4_9EUKA|nr:hypothetical protein BLNAU_4426 [Blattamonas nauphoetae]
MLTQIPSSDCAQHNFVGRGCRECGGHGANGGQNEPAKKEHALFLLRRQNGRTYFADLMDGCRCRSARQFWKLGSLSPETGWMTFPNCSRAGKGFLSLRTRFHARHWQTAAQRRKTVSMKSSWHRTACSAFGRTGWLSTGEYC